MATEKEKKTDEQGVALMLVLLLVVLLAAITFEYAYETRIEASLAANGRAHMEAYIAAKSAVAIGMSLLQADQIEKAYGMDPQMGANPAAYQRHQNPHDPHGGFGEYDSKWDSAWGQPIVQQINNAILHCNIEDECGKLNLNVFADFSAEQEFLAQEIIEQPEGLPPEGGMDGHVPQLEARIAALEMVLRNLFEDMQVEMNPTDAILDWLDADDEVRPEGAEHDFYASLETPYACKNGPLESIEELLLIAGITPEIYFDLNRDPEETRALREQEDELYPVSSLPDLLTATGSIEGKINVNTARPELLTAIFQDPAAVEAILIAQMESPFRDVQDLAASVNMPHEMAGLLDVKSNVFRIQGDGFVDDVMVRIEAYVVRPDIYSEIPMPFRILSWRVIR